MKKMEKNAPNLQTGMLLLSVCYIAIGVVLLIFPNVSLPDICRVIGVVLLIVGAINVAWYFLRKCYMQQNHWGFSVGVGQIFLGVFAVMKTPEMALAFAQLLGICMIADCIVKSQFSMDLLRIKNRIWPVMLIVSVVMAILAMVILYNPFSQDGALNAFTYWVLILDGIVNILTILYVSSQMKKFYGQLAVTEEE